jgi:cell wall-associated NlpC family hydrolase
MTPDSVVKKYLGVPYRHQGRDLKFGVDCYGLILSIYADAGIKLRDIDADYDEHWSWEGKNYFIDNYHSDWEKVVLPNPKFLDIVGFINRQGIMNHAGVMLDDCHFINTVKAGTVVGNINDTHWANKVVGFYRYKTR